MLAAGYTQSVMCTETGDCDIDGDYPEYDGVERGDAENTAQAEALDARLRAIVALDVKPVCWLRISAVLDPSKEGPSNRWTHMNLADENGNAYPAMRVYRDLVDE